MRVKQKQNTLVFCWEDRQHKKELPLRGSSALPVSIATTNTVDVTAFVLVFIRPGRTRTVRIGLVDWPVFLFLDLLRFRRWERTQPELELVSSYLDAKAKRGLGEGQWCVTTRLTIGGFGRTYIYSSKEAVTTVTKTATLVKCFLQGTLIRREFCLLAVFFFSLGFPRKFMFLALCSKYCQISKHGSG